MKNQSSKQKETSTAQVKRKKNFLRTSLTLRIVATGFIVNWLMMSSCTSSSRPSTKPELKEQKELQRKWEAEQKIAEQKWDSALKVIEQK